jgi:hypothetical protein
MVVATPPSPPAIVRAWSKALNANDNKAAASLFAPGAELIQGVDVRLTPRLALAWNQSLPCGGTIIGLTRSGDRVRATFLLKERPKHTCDGPGQKAAAVFIVKKGKIVFWEQVSVKQTGVGA